MENKRDILIENIKKSEKFLELEGTPQYAIVDGVKEDISFSNRDFDSMREYLKGLKKELKEFDKNL